MTPLRPLVLLAPSALLLLTNSTAALALGPQQPPAQLEAGSTPATTAAPQLLESEPVRFVENRGQWEERVAFVARAWGGAVRVESDAVQIHLRHAAQPRALLLRLAFEGARPTACARGEGLLPGVHNFLLGDDPRAWRSGARGFERIVLEELYAGTDLVLLDDGGRLRYDLVFEPEADPSKVIVTCEGATGLALGAEGSLVIRTELGAVLQSAPVAWQVHPDGERVPVECRFRLLDGRRYGFTVPELDRSLPLVVDPGLNWSTFLGGSSFESAYAVDVDAAGNATVTGQTGSSDFPTTPGAFDTTYNGFAFSDVFVTRFDPGGTLLYSTFLGGTSGEEGRGVQADGQGVVTVTGTTSSSNFPTTTGAFDTSLGGSGDVFVARLSAQGDALLYGTYLGGSGGDAAGGVTVDGSGTAFVVGTTSSGDFPTTAGALDRTLDGTSDAFVTAVSSTGASLEYSTLLGGSDGDTGMGIALDGAGRVVATGVTSSGDFPTTAGAFDTGLGGMSDAWVAKLDATGGSLLLSTYFGGSDGDTGEDVDVDSSDRLTITGVTSSADLPTTAGAFDTTLGGNGDGFVARLDPSGASLDYSTYFGGSSGEAALIVDVDASGVPTVAGVTSSSDFPVTSDAYDATLGGSSDAFVTRLSSDGSALMYSTYVGGSSGDVCEGMDVGPAGEVVIAGTTSSSDYPLTAGAADPSYSAPSECFVTSLEAVNKLASASFRGDAAGKNLDGYLADPPVLGSGWTASVDNSGTGNSLAGVVGYATPLDLCLPSLGFSVLVNVLDSGGELLALPAGSGSGVVTFGLTVPDDPTLCGLAVATQGFGFGGGAGIQLHNAFDLVVGF